MKNPFLVGEKVYLRSLEESDLTLEYMSWFNDAKVTEFNSHHRFPYDKAKMQEYYDEVIKSEKNLILGIFDKESDTHIGNIALQDIDSLNQSAEFAIIIGDTNFQGKGVGKEASRLVLNHGFKSLNLHRIFCGTSEANIGMQKLAEFLGFQKEGTAREAMFKDGAFRNVLSYGILADEFKN